MLASARVAYLARRAAYYGVQTRLVSVDLARVRQRKRAIVESWRAGSQHAIQGTPGVDLLFGEASFTGPKSVQVRLNDGGVFELSGDLIFVSTGARRAVPPIPGLDRVPALNSTTIMELGAVPEHLVVLGAGYVGLEFGQMFRRFGGRVTNIEKAPRMLVREDSDVAGEVARVLRQDGIDLLFESQTTRVEPAAGGGIHLQVHTPEGDRTLVSSHLLVSLGRVPNSDQLNLAAAGIETNERGYIRVNERLETSVPRVYALGDVNGGPPFTHVSYNDFRIMRTNLIEDGAATTAGRIVSYTIFIDPQLGRVGMTEQEARRQRRRILVAKLPMANVARAIETDETRGFMKAVVDAETQQILGAAILGVEGGEIMSVLEMAILGRLPYTVLKEAIFVHPTLADSLNNLFMALDQSGRYED
jgi:pyruvate/2-oxoglutarate dehydrogenase complex dihydrolipoamide dehydrogenase (E3) component